MSIRPSVRAAPAYRFQARPARVKLDQNEAPRDLPEELRETALARLATVAWNRYPEMEAEGLRRRLAARHDWPAEGLAVAGGSNVLIQSLVIAAGIGQRVVAPSPTFPVYRSQAELLGAELVEVPLREDFGLPLEGLLGAMRGGRGVAFVANPAAPTGNLHPREEIAALLDAAGREWTVVIDEAYGEFAGSDHLDLVRRHPNALSLRTFSKALGLGGVRLGYALAAPELATELRKVVMPFSVSALQLAVGEAALERAELLEARVAGTIAERERLLARLRELPGLEPFPSRANFVLVRVADPVAVWEGLLARGVLVRRQDHLPGLSGCLRVSVGLPEETDALVAALAEVLEPAATPEAPRG